MIILQEDEGPLGLFAHGLQDVQRIVGVVDLTGLRVDQTVHDGPVTQLVLLSRFSAAVEMPGDGFEFRLDALFLGRDEIEAGITGLKVVNDAGAHLRRRTCAVRGGARV